MPGAVLLVFGFGLGACFAGGFAVFAEVVVSFVFGLFGASLGLFVLADDLVPAFPGELDDGVVFVGHSVLSHHWCSGQRLVRALAVRAARPSMRLVVLVLIMIWVRFALTCSMVCPLSNSWQTRRPICRSSSVVKSHQKSLAFCQMKVSYCSGL